MENQVSETRAISTPEEAKIYRNSSILLQRLWALMWTIFKPFFFAWSELESYYAYPT